MLRGMSAPLDAPALATLMLLAGADLALAQDPAFDLPHRRVEGLPDVASCVEEGLLRLRAGWDWQAARMFRELVLRAEDQPLGYLGLALALRREPNRAARLCWQAVERLPQAGPSERAVVRAYQRYFAVTGQPELVDPRYQEQPGRLRARQLISALEAISRADDDFAASLAAIERRSLDPPALGDRPAAALGGHNLWLRDNGAMPFLIPGYDVLLREVVGEADPVALARLPRHPGFGAGDGVVARLPGLGDAGVERWRPRQAPGFDLPRGLGGRVRFADQRDKPLLVVFFLGFG